jgi:predicted phage terminase large subunit-like protein
MPTETLQLERLVDDPEIRRAAAKTLKGFCFTYLPHHFPLIPSDFFDEMTHALESADIQRLEIIGYRGCAKSTVASLALVIWAALEHPEQYPFIVMLADTRSQASLNAASVQNELRNNDLILRDYGHLKYRKIDDPRPEPTLESDEDWQAMNCVLDNGVRILSRSRGQKVRGMKHRQHRPSLVVADDVEDLDWVRTQENRDKSDRWFRGNVLPSVDEQTGRVVVIGNWLHTDGLMARLKNTGIFKVLEFPLLRDGPGTEVERCTWRAKYATQEAIDRRRDELGDIGFRREMLLQVVPEEGQDVLPEDITYYDDPPFDDGNYLAHGGDLAISTKESADCTSLVSGEITWNSGTLEIFVQPNPLNRRMSFHETMDAFDNVRHSSTMSSEFYIEGVAYQQAAIEEMERRAFSVKAMHPIKDKRSRLRVAARYIKNGTVKFPRHGCEELLNQLFGFGAEKHDDLVDALVWLILGVAGDGIDQQVVHYVG